MIKLSFCEPGGASPWTRTHLREIGPEGRMPGGGIPGKTLCDSNLRKGWDLDGDVTTASIQDALKPGMGALCQTCGSIGTQLLALR